MEPFFIWCALILSLPFIAVEPSTTVVLLENNASHNAIDVSTQSGKVTIDQPYYATTLSAPDKKPSKIEKVDTESINKKYADLLMNLPDKATSMLFYFEPGTAEITQSSKNQVEMLIKTITLHEPVWIDIIGHSDREGDTDKNYELALERAHAVEKFLSSHDVNMERISVVSYGESEPIIPTEDGVAEPLNRRVEVIVR